MGKTIAQRYNADGIVKAGEMIEVRQSAALTLHDRRILNLLIRHAGAHIAEDREHVLPMRDLRSPAHRGGERVRDSIDRLMNIRVMVPTRDSKGNKATTRTTLLSDTTTTDDETKADGEVRYCFSPTMREIMRQSQYWGRIKPHVMFAFSTKYALALYEALCLRRNLDRETEIFEVDDFRELLGVPVESYKAFPQLKQTVIAPALEEINGLSDFDVLIEPIRKGGQQRGTLLGFRVTWSAKEPEEWEKVLAELLRSKVGRKARIKGQVVDTLSTPQLVLTR